jgi:hypothetical protein
VVDDALFKRYLQEKLRHLSRAERPLTVSVLVKAGHVFHEEGSNDFQGTDLAEHKETAI